MQIQKDIYQVSGSLNGLTFTDSDANYDDCNVYVLKTAEGLIMFDCGCGETLPQIFENMKAWDLDPTQIKACFITHPHLDHCGAAHLLKEAQIPLYSHQYTAESIEKGDSRCCGYLYHKHFCPCTVDYPMIDKQVVEICGYPIEALHMPGHTLGCTAFAFEHFGKKIIVSGDIIGTLLVGYFGWSGSIDFDKKAYLSTLGRFSTIDSDIMLPGHGMVYFHKPRRRVEDAFTQALSEWR